jgi:hypothetical protein
MYHPRCPILFTIGFGFFFGQLVVVVVVVVVSAAACAVAADGSSCRGLIVSRSGEVSESLLWEGSCWAFATGGIANVSIAIFGIIIKVEYLSLCGFM